MPRFALSGIFLIGASVVLFAGATEGPRAVPVAKDTWATGIAWASSALASAIDVSRRTQQRVREKVAPEKVGPPQGLASPPTAQRRTGPPAATPVASAAVAPPSGASPPAAPAPRSNVAPPREAAAASTAPSVDTQQGEVNDLRDQVKKGQAEIAALAAERDRERQELEALRRQQQAQAAAPPEPKSQEKVAASNAPEKPAPETNVTPPREAAAPATAAASKDPGGAPQAEVNDLRGQVKKSQAEIASLSAELDKARQELEALRQQQQTQAAAPPEPKSQEKIAASNISPRPSVTASRVPRARPRRHVATAYRPERTPSDETPRLSSDLLY